jgi:hypothetical protein
MSRLSTASLSLICLIISCSGSSDVRYKWTGDTLFPIEETVRSKEPIDNYPANELFFSITAPEDAVSITIMGDAPTGLITGERREVPLYMIIEREIKTSSGDTFVEIGRNFNRSWDHKKELTIRTDNTIPFVRLEPGIFRVRFTSFDKNKYKVIIKAGAAHPIAFSADKPVKTVTPSTEAK